MSHRLKCTLISILDEHTVVIEASVFIDKFMALIKLIHHLRSAQVILNFCYLLGMLVVLLCKVMRLLIQVQVL